MKKVINLILFFLLVFLIFFAGYLVRFCTEEMPVTGNSSQYLAEIETQRGKIECLQDSILLQKEAIDSLKQYKGKIDTLWKVKIVALKSLTLAGQYEVLSNNLSALCNLETVRNYYYLEGDTFCLFTSPELLCINTAFMERDMFEEELYATEDILAATEDVVSKQDEIIRRQDTILLQKDSICLIQQDSLRYMAKQLKNRSLWNKATTGAAIVSLILYITK